MQVIQEFSTLILILNLRFLKIDCFKCMSYLSLIFQSLETSQLDFFQVRNK